MCVYVCVCVRACACVCAHVCYTNRDKQYHRLPKLLKCINYLYRLIFYFSNEGLCLSFIIFVIRMKEKFKTIYSTIKRCE